MTVAVVQLVGPVAVTVMLSVIVAVGVSQGVVGSSQRLRISRMLSSRTQLTLMGTEIWRSTTMIQVVEVRVEGKTTPMCEEKLHTSSLGASGKGHGSSSDSGGGGLRGDIVLV